MVTDDLFLNLITCWYPTLTGLYLRAHPSSGSTLINTQMTPPTYKRFQKKVEAPSASVAEFFVHSITFTRQTRLNPNITSPTVQQRTAYTVIQTRRMDHQHCLLHASFRQSSCSMQNAIDQRHSQMSLADIHWPALGSNGYSTRSAQPLTLQR